MYRGYRIVCVTPAGRRRYMELLVPYILRSALIDEYQLWQNTTDADDLAFLHRLPALDPRILLIPPPQYRVNGIHSIGQFFRFCVDPGAIYIRFDDDIVWMDDGFFESLLDFRIDHPEYFLVSPMVVNNALCSYALQSRGRWHSDFGRVTPYAADSTGWANPKYAHHLHNLLLHMIEIGDLSGLRFDAQPVALCRFSINCIAWFGREFAEFGGHVPREYEEEEWISATRPTALGRANCIFGGALAAHFAFYLQREYLDATDVLARYRDLLPTTGSGGRSADADCRYGELRGRFEALLARDCHWQYSRTDGAVICPDLVLARGGRIEGYRHFNETRWSIENGRVCFLDGEGRITTRFYRLARSADERLEARGLYLRNAVDFEHVLRQCDMAG